MDINPYAIKNEKGKSATVVRLKSKLLIISGIIAPKILVTSDMQKKIRKMRISVVFFCIKYRGVL